MNQPSEECDGPDSPSCPGACQVDCVCGVVVAIVDADVSVRARDPDENFGAASLLEVDADSPKQAFLRVRVSGVGLRQVTSARLRLQVAPVHDAESRSGGRIHQIGDCEWDDERTMTWETRPRIDGPMLDTVGTVRRGDLVEFDVTEALQGDGVYCFALDSRSSNGVKYNSREGREKHPAFGIEVVP